MSTDPSKSNQTPGNEEAAVKPDEETLHTTDPQEHMEGPLSSLMKKAEKGFEKEDTDKEDESKKK